MTLNNIIKKIRHFRDERDWAQFHNSKDMAIAISIEANELLEQFLWKTTDEVEASVKKHRKDIEEEIADIGIYLVELADNLDIDLSMLVVTTKTGTLEKLVWAN